MIKIEKYSDDFEKEYYECVCKHLVPQKDKYNKVVKNHKKKTEQFEKKILEHAKFFMGKEIASFEELILMPYEQIQENYNNMKGKEEYVKLNKSDFDKMREAYKRIAGSKSKKKQMNVRMVEETGMYVCPYCNRNYISSRGDDVSGAQLDHFYSKDKYPIFALSLYNLVPSCGDCNRIKSKTDDAYISPFQEGVNWDSITFSYKHIDYINKKVTVKSSDPNIQSHLNLLKVEEAYQIHGKEVNELLEKKERYMKTQIEEFNDVLNKIKMSDDEYKKMIFGDEISIDKIKETPLGKMKKDLEKELGIY